MKDFYYYPMVLTQTEATYKITFPDFKEVKVEGKNIEAAVHKGKEKLAHYIYELGENATLPEATDPKDIVVNENEVVMLADVNMLLYTFTYKPKSVTRAITLPEGLNELAKQSGMNVSLVAQEAIKKYLGIKEED